MDRKQKRSFMTAFTLVLGIIVVTLGLYFGLKPSRIEVERDKYPNCELIHTAPSSNQNVLRIGDQICDRSMSENITYGFNSIECGYDDNDCLDFNTRYASCDQINGTHPSLLSDLGRGTCKEKYNRKECGFDLGLCLESR
jgi:hypothetical protein